MEVRDATRAVYRVEPEAARADDDVPSGYKRTEVGVIPEDWELPSLQMVGTFLKGQGIRKDESSSGSIPCVRYGEIYTHHNDILRKFNSHISERVSQSSTPLKPGDILFAGSGETKEEIGKAVAYVGQERAYAGGDIVILTPRGFASTFLGYSLNAPSVVRQKAARGQGDAVVHITSGALSSVVVPVPPTLAEQQAIAEALSDADALIESLQQLIAKQRALKQGAMQALLTGRQRLPGFTGEWSRAELRKIVSTPITDGPHMTPAFQEGGVPFLSVNNLVNNRIDLTDLRYISTQDDETFARKCKPRRGDVLVGKAASVGKVALVENDFNFNIWSPIALVRLSPAALPRFVYYQLLSADCSLQIAILTNSSSQGNIGMGDIETIQVSYPPLDEQTAIVAMLSDMDAGIEALEARLAKTRALKTGMMQQLLTGRIRLPLERAA